jgi:hypothetical protein
MLIEEALHQLKFAGVPFYFLIYFVTPERKSNRHKKWENLRTTLEKPRKRKQNSKNKWIRLQSAG